MNPFLKNLNRVEFVITYACTGQCKHCSEGDHASIGEHINGDIAAEMVGEVAGNYSIDSIMTFGGEPLLYPDAVCKIHSAGRDAGISKRQLITNGFFSRDEVKIKCVAETLVNNGVNDILLSVDAFHQETIPIKPVILFAQEIHALNAIEIQVHPAWLVSNEADNIYNRKTREILAEFDAIGISASDGNVIFPRGNALKHLSEYFDVNAPQVSPYFENPNDIKAICVNPDGEVLGGNIYKTSILEIIENYTPKTEE